MDRLINEWLFKLGLNSAFITNKIKRWNVLEYRQCIQWKLYYEHNYSTPEIARYFEQVPTTVRHGVLKIQSMKETDSKIKDILSKF